MEQASTFSADQASFQLCHRHVKFVTVAHLVLQGMRVHLDSDQRKSTVT
jgi:hypothetical protein